MQSDIPSTSCHSTEKTNKNKTFFQVFESHNLCIKHFRDNAWIAPKESINNSFIEVVDNS